MKTLIVYYSRTWTTKQAAQTLASRFDADLCEIIDKKDRSWAIWWIVSGKDATLKNITEIEDVNLDIQSYELVIIGTPVRAWLMTPAIRTFIQKFDDKLSKVAVFTTQMWESLQRYQQEFEEIFGKRLKTVSFFLTKDVKKNNLDTKIDEFIKNIN